MTTTIGINVLSDPHSIGSELENLLTLNDPPSYVVLHCILSRLAATRNMEGAMDEERFLSIRGHIPSASRVPTRDEFFERLIYSGKPPVELGENVWCDLPEEVLTEYEMLRKELTEKAKERAPMRERFDFQGS